jgi:hypothetical protein
MRLALLAPLLVCDCRAPTQIYVDVYSEVACDKAPDVIVTVGQLGELESRPPSSSVRRCDPATGRVGTVVLHPSGDTDDAVAFKVVTNAAGGTSEGCAASGYKGCIVARRGLRFMPNTSLRVRVDLRVQCIDQPCADPTDTCVRGRCIPAHIPDPSQCASATGCDEGVLGPIPDGGKPDTDADATLTVDGDSAAADARTDGEAGPPAAVLGCTADEGTDREAAWPTEGYCRNHRFRSPYTGPATKPSIKGTPAQIGPSIWGTPVIDRNGNVYVASTNGHLVSYDASGGLRWEKNLLRILGTGLITKDGNIHYGSVDNRIYSFRPDGTEVNPPQTAPTYYTPLTVSPDGTFYFTNLNSGLVAWGPSGQIWSKTIAATTLYTTPLVLLDGRLVLAHGRNTLIIVPRDGGAESYSPVLQAGVSLDQITMETPNGRLVTFGYDNRVVAAADATTFARAWAVGTVSRAMGIAGADDGTVYACTEGGGLLKISPAGVKSTLLASGTCGTPLIDAEGTVYAAMDGALVAFNSAGTEKWQLEGTPTTSMSPSMAKDGSIYLGGVDGKLYTIIP